MAAPTMHRPAALLSALLALTLTLAPARAPLARAQEPGPVTLTLVSQTPWTSITHPSLDIQVRAQNVGDAPIDRLSLGVTLWGPVFTRTAYEDSLVADPSNSVVIDVQTLPREGTLEAGETRIFNISLEMTSPGLSTTRSLIYPLKIDLRSGFTSLAAIRTPVVFLVEKPQTPLNLAWTFVLSSPIDVGPDGVFRAPDLEQSLAPGGRIAGEIRALLEIARQQAGTPVDLAISPALLLQLTQMRDGYSVMDGGVVRKVPAGEGGAAAAAQAIADLKEIVASSAVELSALPFSVPELPALIAGGLSHDLQVQLERGRETVATILGRAPDPAILRPPGSLLNQESLDALPGQGVSLLLLDPSTVPAPAQALGYAPPATTSLAVGDATVTAIVSDPDVQAFMSSAVTSQDPVLAAQTVLGELAAIWNQVPGTERGIAIALSENLAAPPGFFAPLARGIAAAPWLAPRSASTLAASFPPQWEGTLAPSEPVAFPRSYVDALKQARLRVDAYRSMLVGDTTVPDRLDTQLLLAESGQFVVDQADGEAFIRNARQTAGAIFEGVRADTSQQITLTSSAGATIPLRITNDNAEPLRVTVRLVSQFLRASPESTIVLDPGSSQNVNLHVQLTTTGKRSVTVQIVSPSGRVISQATLIVRSTAYNRIALLITLGAALLAFLIWARRFVPRRTT